MGELSALNSPKSATLTAIHVLHKQRWFIIIFCFSAVLFSLLFTYVFSERYRAQAVILYQPVESSILRQKTTETFGAPVPIASFKVILQTLRDTVTTENVLRPVVDKLQLDQEIQEEYATWYSRVYHQTKNTVKEWGSNLWSILKYGRIPTEDPTIAAMKHLAKNIEIVSAPRDSYIYVLRVKDKYPQRAAAIANEVSRTLVQLLKDEQQRNSTNKMDQLAGKLREQEDKIVALRQQRKALLETHNVVSIPAETDKGLANLYELQLKQVQLEAQISKRRQEIETYNKNITEQKVTQSEDISKMRSQKLFSEVDLQGLIAESEYTQNEIKELKATLDRMPGLQQQTDVLDNEIASAIREHEILKDFHTEILGQDKTAQSETTLLAEAFVPAAPIQPIKIYHVGLTGLLAFIFSVGFVFVLDFVEAEKSKMSSTASRTGKIFIQAGMKAAGLLDELAVKLAAQGGSLYLKDQGKLVLAKSLDRDRAVPSVLNLPLPPTSVFGQVMASGEPIVVQDIQHRNDLQSSGWNGYKDNSFMVLPVHGKSGEPVGLISLHNKTKPPFVNDDKKCCLELIGAMSTKPKRKSVFGRILGYVPVLLMTAVLAACTFYVLRKVGF